MKHVFGYIRVSDPKQGVGVSLHEQKEAIVCYAQKNGLYIDQWFEEIKTAAKSGRPQFMAMLKGLREKEVDGVIIHKIDRSARNLRDWADLAELMDNGIEVHFAHESIDMSARGGRLSADIQAVIASDYIRNLREETLKGIYGRLKQGIYPFKAPLGYLDAGRGKPKTIDKSKAPLIKELFKLYGTNTFSIPDLVKHMYKLGLRNIKDKKVTMNGISKILNNPFYMGIMRVQGKSFNGKHKPLISPALFNLVQDILRGKTVLRKVKHDYLFRRHVKCAECGYTLIPETQKGYVYYRCHSKECPMKCIREEHLEMAMENYFSLMQIDNNQQTELFEAVKKLEKDHIDVQKEIIENLRLQINQLDYRAVRLTDALIDGHIDKDAYENRNKEFLHSRRELEDKLHKNEENQKSIFDQVRKYLERLKDLKTTYNAGILLERRQMVHAFTSNLVTDGQKVSIAMKSPFQELYCSRIFDQCDLHCYVSRTPIPKFTHYKNTTTIPLTSNLDFGTQSLTQSVYTYIKNTHESNRDYKNNHNNL